MALLSKENTTLKKNLLITDIPVKYRNKIGQTSDKYKNKYQKEYTRTNSINF